LRILRGIGWETAVVFLTDHILNKELDEALNYATVEWMSKPATLEQLADAVNCRLSLVWATKREPLIFSYIACTT